LVNSKIYSNFYNTLEIGDNFPTVIMGVINLSPESFYKGSIYKGLEVIKNAAKEMISNGAKMLDIGARSTAPWSKKISIEEEKERIIPALEIISESIENNIILSIDTQYRKIAEVAYDITKKFNKKIIINDVSCLKTDPSLIDFIISLKIPLILMASKKIPGDLCKIEDIIEELGKTINLLKDQGYNEDYIIIDPGIGHWVEKKTYKYDLKIIDNLPKLRVLQKPILVAISRKSFIGNVLKIQEPEKRLAGSLSSTAIAVYNGAHIVRTHDVNKKLLDIIKMAEAIRKNH
jgi:dihydropteroate synthase